MRRGIPLARLSVMSNKDRNPSANVPEQTDEEPKGDRGQGDKTWAPPADEQGVSNRAAHESESVNGEAGRQDFRSRDEIIEDNIEHEENRNAEQNVQQAPQGRTRRRGTTGRKG
jgi:hypothetical protein